MVARPDHLRHLQGDGVHPGRPGDNDAGAQRILVGHTVEAGEDRLRAGRRSANPARAVRQRRDQRSWSASRRNSPRRTKEGGERAEDLFWGYAAATWYFGFFCEKAPFDDATGRQAFAQAVDLNVISSAVLNGIYPPEPRILPAQFCGGDEQFAPTFDVEAAKASLAASNLRQRRGRWQGHDPDLRAGRRHGARHLGEGRDGDGPDDHRQSRHYRRACPEGLRQRARAAGGSAGD